MSTGKKINLAAISAFIFVSNAYALDKIADKQPASVNSTIAEDMVAEINKMRAKKQLFLLKPAPTLYKLAQQHSDKMSAENKLSHQESVMKAAENIGSTYGTTAEVVACGHADAKATLAQWMASPKHKEKLVMPELQHIGVGYTPAAAVNTACPHFWTVDLASDD